MNAKRIIAALLTVCFCALFVVALTACSEDDLPEVSTAAWHETDEYTLYADGSSSQDYIVNIEKDADRDFVILNLTDVQIGKTEMNLYASFYEKLLKIIDELIPSVRPDLITLTGDQSYGEISVLRAICSQIDKYGIPWAPVYGNHDNNEDGQNIARQAYMYENEYKNCLFKAGPSNLGHNSNGTVLYGNYIVNVTEKDASARGFHVVKSLLFVNSGDTMEYTQEDLASSPVPAAVNKSSYAHLTDEQIEWYKWAANGVQAYGNDAPVSSAVFLHIPIFAYNTAFAEAVKSDTRFSVYNYNEFAADTADIDLAVSHNDGYESAFGYRREWSGTPPYDDGVFDVIKAYGTDLMLAGHDHINNFVIDYQGVTLAYGLKTGSGCYYDEDLCGGTILTVASDGKTQVRHTYYNPWVPVIPAWLIVLITLGGAALITAVVLIILKKKGILKPIKKYAKRS